MDIVKNKLDLCTYTETWLTEYEHTIAVSLCFQADKIHYYPWTGKLEGGVVLLYKDSLPVKQAANYDYSNMEYTNFLVSPLDSLPIHPTVVYRLPQTSVLEFGEDLVDYMEKSINSTSELVLTSNFNIHINDKSKSDSIIFHVYMICLVS